MSHHYPRVPQQEHPIPYPLHPHSSHHHLPHGHGHGHPPLPPLPLISVSHLPSATSFYISLLQPLSIQLLHPSTPHQLPPSSTFGLTHLYPAHPLLTLTQSVPQLQIRLAHVVVPAPSLQALHKFCIQSEHLIPGTVGRIERNESGEHCFVRDFDGNVIEAHWADHSLGNGVYGPLVPGEDESLYHPTDPAERGHPGQWTEERPREQRERNREIYETERGRVREKERRRDRDHDQVKGREVEGDRDRRRDGRRDGRRDKDREDKRDTDRRHRRDGRYREESDIRPQNNTEIPNDKESQRVLQWQEDVARSLSTPETDLSSGNSAESGESVDSIGSEELHGHSRLPQTRGNNYSSSDIDRRIRHEKSKHLVSRSSEFRRADSDPNGKDMREQTRAYSRPQMVRRERLTHVKSYHEEPANKSPYIITIKGNNIRGSYVGETSVGLDYDMKNHRPESPPLSPVSSSRNPFAPNPPPPSQLAYGSSGRRTRRFGGGEQALLENKSNKIMERKRRDDRRDSGIGGMSGINSAERHRMDAETMHMRGFLNERSPSIRIPRGRKLISQYDLDPETSETENISSHFDHPRSRDRERDWKSNARSDRQLTILPAAPEPGSYSSESSWSDPDSGPHSEYKSPSKPGRGREREMQKGKQNLGSKIKVRPQIKNHEGRQTVKDDRKPVRRSTRQLSRSQSRPRNHGLHTPSRVRYSPDPSVTSQSYSSASGSTLRADHEILGRVPTPPSAVNPRAYRRSAVDGDRGRRQIHTEQTHRYPSERPRGNRKIFSEYTNTNVAKPPHRAPRDYHRKNQRRSRRVSSEESGSCSAESERDVPLHHSRATDYDDYAASGSERDSPSSVESRQGRRWRR
ncbi:hypothetical protein K3495_g9563 [Podosphaera aphanis]|nr:hypothetical protein K3495_g9563 [Podosphaera aphanis]